MTVYKLVVKDTVEQRILKLQAKKASLAEGALSMSKQKLSEMRLEDLKMLVSNTIHQLDLLFSINQEPAMLHSHSHKPNYSHENAMEPHYQLC